MRMRSLATTRVPIPAIAPFTVTLPSRIHSSISRRDPRPLCASTLCNFCEGASSTSARAVGRAGPRPAAGRGFASAVLRAGGLSGLRGRGRFTALRCAIRSFFGDAPLYVPPLEHRLRERAAVHVLELAADRQTARNAAHLDASRAQELADIMRRRKHELSAWMVLEVAKTWAEADGDTAEAIDFAEFYGREMLRWAQEQPVTSIPGEIAAPVMAVPGRSQATNPNDVERPAQVAPVGGNRLRIVVGRGG